MGMKLSTVVSFAGGRTYREVITEEMEATLHGYFWGRVDEMRKAGRHHLATAQAAQDWREWSSAKWEAWVNSYDPHGKADTIVSTFFVDIAMLFDRWVANRS